jgi:hypothetical protein
MQNTDPAPVVAEPVSAKPLRAEWWHYVAILLLISQLVFYVTTQLRPGRLGIVCWYFGSDAILWWGVTLILFLCAFVRSLWRRPMLSRWRMSGYLMLLLLAAAPFAYRVYPSSHDDAPSEVRFRLPLDGPVRVAWGGATPDVNYHVVAPDQRWAYDLLVTKDGTTHTGDGDGLEDYYCYGMSVRAPVDGVIRATYTDAREMPVGTLGGTPAGGNQVVIDVAAGQFLFLCHLQPGSIKVKEGDRVHQGDVVGLVGNSGNTSEPHLHVHLQDTPRLRLGEAVPLYFHDYRVGDHFVERGMPTGGYGRNGFTGDIVTHAGDATDAVKDEREFKE